MITMISLFFLVQIQLQDTIYEIDRGEVEILVMAKPWFDLKPKTDWDDKAVTIPILAISGVSFWHFTKFAFKKGEELDRIATIEIIKKKRRYINN